MNETPTSKQIPTLTPSLKDNILLLEHKLSNINTLIIRKFENKDNSNIKCCIFFFDGMVNNENINEHIIKPVMQAKHMKKSTQLLSDFQSEVLISNDIISSKDVCELVDKMLYGDTIFLTDGCPEALIISTKGWSSRSISEPDSEPVLKGPREGFTEGILTNLSLLRRRLVTPDLKMKFRTVGTRSKTKVCVCYLESLTNPKTLFELENRLDKIQIDGILDTNYIQELIKDSPKSPFKTTGITERPDIVAAKLLEGRVAVFVDGTPSVMTLPYLFIEYFQANDDYYLNYYFSSISRVIRIFGFFVTISAPAIYLALINFHQEMLPTGLLLTIASTRQGIPIPSIVELLLLLFAFELLREAGMRMPSSMGHALSVVSALVLGSAAVEARFISSPMVIVIAITGVTGLMSLQAKSATVLIRLVLIFAVFFLGFLGYVAGITWVLLHLSSISSFGVQYTSYATPTSYDELKDSLIRGPWSTMIKRPIPLSPLNIIRQKRGGRKS